MNITRNPLFKVDFYYHDLCIKLRLLKKIRNSALLFHQAFPDNQVLEKNYRIDYIYYISIKISFSHIKSE